MDSDEKSEKVKRSRGEAKEGKKKHGKALPVESDPTNQGHTMEDRTDEKIRGNMDSRVSGQTLLL